MKSFRTKIMLYLTLLFGGTMLLFLVVFVGHSVATMLGQQKDQLKRVAKSLIHDLPQGGALPTELMDGLTDKVHFAGGSQQVGFAVFDEKRQLLHKSETFTADVADCFDPTKKSDLYLLSIESGNTFDHLLHKWHFLLRYQRNGYVVFVSGVGKYELVERFVQGLGLSLLATLILAVPSALFISRRVLTPVEGIIRAARKVRAGDLSARINSPETNDEFDDAVSDLNDAFDELEASFSRLQRFSGDAAHELKTPLTSIRGSLEVCLMKERNKDEYKEVLEDCLEEIAQLTSIVENLLLLASPGDGSSRAFDCIDLSTVVRDSIERFEFIPEYRQRDFSVNVEAEVLCTGDRSLLLRLVYNLVHNALKYSETGPVRIGLSTENGLAKIKVEDHGYGIAPGELEHIFERFYQVNSSRTDGCGLGLSLVKWIVDLHHGTIAVDSRVAEGTCFTVCLPLKHKNLENNNEQNT